MPGAFGFEPQPVRGSIPAHEVGAALAQSQQPAPAPMTTAQPMAAPQPQEYSSAVGSALEDHLTLERNGGTGARPKGPYAEGRLARLGITPQELEFFKRSGVV